MRTGAGRTAAGLDLRYGARSEASRRQPVCNDIVMDGVSAADFSRMTSPARLHYGPDPSQFADLFVPRAADYPVPKAGYPVAVVLHGGFWRQRYDLSLALPLAADFAARGVAALAVEYRRWGPVADSADNAAGADGADDAAGTASAVGTGGWPRTGMDVAAAVDCLATLGRQAAGGGLDLGRIVAVGHSAGGQLAAWLAHRGSFAAGDPGFADADAVLLRGAVSQAGILDVAAAACDRLGDDDPVPAFMGAQLADDPERYRQASPTAAVGDGAAVVCVHGAADDTVPMAQSADYVAAARAEGDPAELVVLPGVGHMELVDVTHVAWATCRDAALRLLGRG